MFNAIVAAFVAIFTALLPFLMEKTNEPKTGQDAPKPPDHVRDRWLSWAQGRVRSRK